MCVFVVVVDCGGCGGHCQHSFCCSRFPIEEIAGERRGRRNNEGDIRAQAEQNKIKK
jgi:hypothetical protein